MEKRENFKFSQRTSNNIRALVEELQLARNKTEAIDIALEHIVTEERTKLMMRRTDAPTGTPTDIAQLFMDSPQNPRAVA